MGASERVTVVVNLIPLERLGRKPTVEDMRALGRRLLEGDPIVDAIEVQSESRYFYNDGLWKALFADTVFDVRNLKIKTSGLSNASLRALLLHTKRLQD